MRTGKRSSFQDVAARSKEGLGKAFYLGTEAVLVAYWQLQSPDGSEVAYRFSERKALSRDGYAALVDAQRSLLRELARRIGQSL